MQNGLSQAQIDAIDSYQGSEAFSAREQLALEYAERVTFSDQDVDEAFFARLQSEFPEPAQIVELTWRIALCGAFNRFNDVLQTEIDAGVSVIDQAASA